MRSRHRMLAAAVLATAASVVGAAAPAFAHNYPVGSTPAENATVTEQPGTIALTTNDNLIDFGNGNLMRVVGPDGTHYGDGCARVDGPTVEMAARLGTPGTYTVDWQVVSTDGHAVSGAFSFDWRPAADVELGTGSPTAPVCPTAAPEQTDAAAPETPAAEASAPSASVSDLLWIGGALLAVVIAVAVTLMLTLGRRRTPPGED